MRFIYIFSLFFLPVLLCSCPGEKPIDTTTQMELTADSVYYYSKEIYYWNTALPDYNTFNPRKYKSTDELKTAEATIAAVRTFNTNDNTHTYSFASSYEQGGLTKSGEDIDYGFLVKSGYNFSASGTPTFKGWFVNYVYPGSDAGLAGVKRGWRLSKVDGTVLPGTQAIANFLSGILINHTVTTANFEFIKPDGSTQANSFTYKKFTANPVLYYEVITTTSGKKVGYFVFNRFFGQSARDEIGSVFTYFQSQHINELIVDLRYNLGGITKTQDTLANLIAPASANGRVMYTYEYNQQLQGNNFPLLKKKFGWPNGFFSKDNNTVTFTKKGSLNLSRVFVIVSDNTASSSELLINNLKPVMNVQLIGDDNTRGKPVGFFGIDLFEKVTFYPVSFRTINQLGQSDYYTGFTPDQEMYDGVDKNWGDRTEDCLYAALFYIENGVYPTLPTSSLPRSVYPQLKLAPQQTSSPGMIRDLQ